MKHVGCFLIVGLLMAAGGCINQTEPLQTAKDVQNVLSYPESIAMQEYMSDGFGTIALGPEGRGVIVSREVQGDLIVVHVTAIPPEDRFYFGSPEGLESTSIYFDAKTLEVVKREIQV